MRTKIIKIICYVLGIMFFVGSFYNVKSTLDLIKYGITTNALVVKCFPAPVGIGTDELVNFKTTNGENINARISSNELLNCDPIGGQISIIYNPKNVLEAQYQDKTYSDGYSANNLVEINNPSSLWDMAIGLFIIGFLFFTFIPNWLILRLVLKT